MHSGGCPPPYNAQSNAHCPKSTMYRTVHMGVQLCGLPRTVVATLSLGPRPLRHFHIWNGLKSGGCD